MRTTEQRITALHQRAGELHRRREKTALFLPAVLSCILFAVLTGLTAFSSRHSAGITEDAFTGASFLDESAGGYVLAAVIAFMAGVCITAVIIRYRNGKK